MTDHPISGSGAAGAGQADPRGQPAEAAVAGLHRSDLRAPGITRDRDGTRWRYQDPSGAEIAEPEPLARIAALAIPPAWIKVWISPDPLGHVQATGLDSKGRTQYRYHELWRARRDAEKFTHVLRFAEALPTLRAATLHDLRRRSLDRERVASAAVRLIDLGLFRIGGEKYAELDHHYGATTLEKRHVTVTRNDVRFDYVAKEGLHRLITITDPAVRPIVRTLARSDNALDALFCWQRRGTWHPLHSHDVSDYIAVGSGGHFTAKEFRTWNATVLMALFLANTGTSDTERARTRAIAASVRGVAQWLGDTPTVTRASYIHPQVISRYESEGRLPAVPVMPPALPAPVEAEVAVADLLVSA